ncbi:type II toxin-antitoxin system YafO family toxin [uncultured Pseudomonas sp.]|jgi:mRNA interferase YafO|uniref:type II toxin-antitoxin system YafO family toxin n=1 Tax=uncultured Pseudomonas sp. TaxID=114707 RepID=UPI00262A9514|nr:type II toxin-antitoxin system YafO family toxin [uncultured Pseudomonas sp.]
MAVDVRFHPETFALFFKPVDDKHPGLSAKLLEEFTRYVKSERQQIPSIFGKDVPYMQPIQAAQACMMHIHIKIPPAAFPKNTPQHSRVCRLGRPGDDAALLYVPGELYEDRFLILALFWPDAHGRANDRPTMKALARIAKAWRDQN